MGRKSIEGICHMCGKRGKLSFEHIPPKSMGNTERSRRYAVVDIIKRSHSLDISDKAGIHHAQQQQGSGFQTICESCNNLLGRNYVNEFSECMRELVGILISESPSINQMGIHLESCSINVLGFFKHVISNFCATTQQGSMLDCRDFLLNHASLAFPSHYSLFMFAVPNMAEGLVSTGWCQLWVDGAHPGLIQIASLAYCPVGFYLLNKALSTTEPAFYLGCDITSMAKYAWGERPQFKLDLPFMTLKSGFPKPVWLSK